MATTAINTGKKSGVNKRLQDYIMENVGHDIHTLECLFHVNEIHFTHVVSLVGPGMMQEELYLIRSIASQIQSQPRKLFVKIYRKFPSLV